MPRGEEGRGEGREMNRRQERIRTREEKGQEGTGRSLQRICEGSRKANSPELFLELLKMVCDKVMKSTENSV